jgi:2,3-bisphosphoglycerate-dependent phosphoglycerate mutase
MPTTYQLLLLRHGQSLWNLENRFTGWTDIDLTAAGRQEAHRAGRRMRQAGLHFDLAFTSVLRRAGETLEIALQEMGSPRLPVQRGWQLNERHYGALQGLSKADTAAHLGKELVMGWRRSLFDRPPALEYDDRRHPRFDPLYAAMPPHALPRSESLADTIARLLPYWQEKIAPAIRSGQQVLIVAHGNSLRALAVYLQDIPPAGVPDLNIPTGVPILYTLDAWLKPLGQQILD